MYCFLFESVYDPLNHSKITFIHLLQALTKYFNPFMPDVFSHHCQLDETISNFRVVGWYFSFLFIF